MNLIKKGTMRLWYHVLDRLYKLSPIIKKYDNSFSYSLKDYADYKNSDVSVNSIPFQLIVQNSEKECYIPVVAPIIKVGGMPFIIKNRGRFCRLDYDALYSYPKGVRRESLYSSGAYIEFQTNAKSVRFIAKISKQILIEKMSLIGTSGFDVFFCDSPKSKESWIHKETVTPKTYYSGNLKHKIVFPHKAFRFIRIYLPNFLAVRAVFLGFCKTDILKLYNNTQTKKPVVCYGSSVTHGCAASRAANNYTQVLSLKLDRDVINLGFAGSALGERIIAKTISAIDSAAIVIEYDHNASVEQLRVTHCNFYENIRKERHNYNTPIVFISRLSGGLSVSVEETIERNKIIEETYLKAIEYGDNKVFYLNGSSLLPEENRQDYFVDDRHPNDRGMEIIAKSIYDILEGKINDC